MASRISTDHLPLFDRPHQTKVADLSLRKNGVQLGTDIEDQMEYAKNSMISCGAENVQKHEEREGVHNGGYDSKDHTAINVPCNVAQVLYENAKGKDSAVPAGKGALQLVACSIAQSLKNVYASLIGSRKL